MFWRLMGKHPMRLLVLAALAASASLPAAGQSVGTGEVVGTVYDSTGAVVVGAKVTIKNNATNLTYETESNKDGLYSFPLLPPGKYTVTVVKANFKTFRMDVEVNVGAKVTADAELALGELTEVVEVVATQIETTAVQSDSLLNQKSIGNLPINGRRFHNFVTLAPTVQIEPQRSGISFAGQRGINSNITVDGLDYNNPFFGGMRGGERANNSFTLPQDAVQEFQVVPFGFSAEFGRSSGGIMNAITKSGTNDWHGSGFLFARHKDLARKDARNRDAVTNLYQFGASGGGPIVHDKTFIFGAYEQQMNDNPRVVVFRRLDGFTPNASQAEAFNFFRSIEEPFTQTNDAWTYLIRGDHQLTQNHRITARYHYSKNTALNAVATGDAIGPETNRALESNGTEGDDTDTIVANWSGIFSPNFINELRATWSQENRPRLANALKPGINSSIGDTGTRSFLPTTLTDWRLQVADNVTWTRGKHTFKFGGEINHLDVQQLFAFNQFGIFGFRTSDTATILNILSVGSGGTGDPANRFDSTLATYRVNIGNGLVAYAGREVAFFVQDSWRITPQFTLTAGFRWEGYFNPTPQANNPSLIAQVASLTTFGRRDPTFLPDNLKQLMPRLGIAWDPWGDGKSVLRANAGIYYARTPLLLMAGPMNNFRIPPGDLSVDLPLALPAGYVCMPIAPGDTCNTVYWQFRRIGIDLNATPLGDLPRLVAEDISDIAAALGLTVDPFRGSQPLTWADNYESPRSFQWSASFEREFARGWTAGAEMVYINTVHLQRNRDWNLPRPLICTGTPLPVGCTSADLSLRPCYGVVGGGRCTQARPVPTLSNVSIRESSARAMYRAVTLRSGYRRGRYQFQVYYTISENFSDDDNERNAGGFVYDDPFNLVPDYNYSSIDSRHQFVFNGVVDLPAGFVVSTLGRFSSGRPFSPVTSSDSNADNSRTDRAYQAPGVPFRRNSFRDRAFYATDLRVAKYFNLPWRESRFEFSVDFFNIFNFDNVTYGSANQEYGLGVSTTGAILAPNDRFMRLRNPASCLSPTNLTGNKACYDTVNNVGSPFTMQLGFRFSW